MNSLTSYLFTGAATIACALADAAVANPNISYYTQLKKPAWIPLNKVFPIVWSSLYTDIAFTSGYALSKAYKARQEVKTQMKKPSPRSYAVALGANLLLNATWSYSFFGSQKPALAALHAGALEVSSIDLVRRTAQLSLPAGIVLAPYAAWTSFATVLSTEVWRINR